MTNKLIFLGTSDFAATILQGLMDSGNVPTIIITRPDKLGGRGKKIILSPVKELALMNNIKIEQPGSKLELTEIIRDIKPDIAIVAAYGMIIPREALELARLGFINVHGSILPKYRGASPVASAILNGDKRTGVTIMKIEERMDAGDILNISEIKIADDDTTESLMIKLAKLGSQALVSTLADYIDGKIVPEKQREVDATYCSMINKEDGLLNPKDDSTTILNKIKAFYPWPGFYFINNTKRIKILKADVSTTIIKPAELRELDGNLYLGTATTAIRIITMQPEGKKPMSDRAFINGNKE